MTITTLTPEQVRAAIAGGAVLVDIRDPAEHARESIPGARNVPLDRLAELAPCDGPVIFHCKSGMRTRANAEALQAAAMGQAGDGADCAILDGGIDGWRGAGLPTRIDRSRPIEVMRQVQIAAGSLVLLGVLLAAFVAPGFIALSGFVGAGLVMAGVTGWCGMAKLLQAMPWNRMPGA